MTLRIKVSELQLADVVSIFPDASYSTATVKQIKDGYVTLFRPYVHTADFSYTGGVITYIGIEEFTIPIDDRVVTVYDRKTLK